jgi:hypothetical protein
VLNRAAAPGSLPSGAVFTGVDRGENVLRLAAGPLRLVAVNAALARETPRWWNLAHWCADMFRLTCVIEDTDEWCEVPTSGAVDDHSAGFPGFPGPR